MDYENILYDKDDRIARITLNRPTALNALSEALQEELVSAMKDAGDDDNIRVVILKAAGRAFSAGGRAFPADNNAGQEVHREVEGAAVHHLGPPQASHCSGARLLPGYG